MKRKFGALILLLSLVFMLASCGLNVPRPAVKEGRFDFSVTYEVNGEQNTLTGVYVCEFNGTDWALDGGYGRDWKAYIEGEVTEEGYGVHIGTAEDGGEIYLALRFYPEYFMGDPAMGDLDVPEPSLTVVYPYDDEGGAYFVTEQDEIYERFGARIVDYEYASPIENSFSSFDFD